MSSPLKQNTNTIESILETINALPEQPGDPILQNKIITPTKEAQTVTADSDYDALNSVTVNAMPTATQATPSISVNSNGLITASATQAAGYVAAGTKSGTKQLTTQAAKTITPSTSSQTAVAKDVYTTGAVTVAAIPSTYVKPTATKAATTYTPTTSNQTIAAGTYCSGIQTIKGDSNLVAGNIKSGVSIFGVNGSYEGSGSGGEISTCSVTLEINTGDELELYESLITTIGSLGISADGFGTMASGDSKTRDNVVSRTAIVLWYGQASKTPTLTINGNASLEYSIAITQNSGLFIIRLSWDPSPTTTITIS